MNQYQHHITQFSKKENKSAVVRSPLEPFSCSLNPSMIIGVFLHSVLSKKTEAINQQSCQNLARSYVGMYGPKVCEERIPHTDIEYYYTTTSSESFIQCRMDYFLQFLIQRQLTQFRPRKVFGFFFCVIILNLAYCIETNMATDDIQLQYSASQSCDRMLNFKNELSFRLQTFTCDEEFGRCQLDVFTLFGPFPVTVEIGRG